jgi:hypothetical protein
VAARLVDRRNMTKGKSHEWQFLCLKALLEPTDSPHLSELVKEAETAISQRLQELRASANGSGEREAIQEVLPSLWYLKHKKFKHSSGFETENRQLRTQ